MIQDGGEILINWLVGEVICCKMYNHFTFKMQWNILVYKLYMFMYLYIKGMTQNWAKKWMRHNIEMFMNSSEYSTSHRQVVMTYQ